MEITRKVGGGWADEMRRLKAHGIVTNSRVKVVQAGRRTDVVYYSVNMTSQTVIDFAKNLPYHPPSPPKPVFTGKVKPEWVPPVTGTRVEANYFQSLKNELDARYQGSIPEVDAVVPPNGGIAVATAMAMGRAGLR